MTAGSIPALATDLGSCWKLRQASQTHQRPAHYNFILSRVVISRTNLDCGFFLHPVFAILNKETNTEIEIMPGGRPTDYKPEYCDQVIAHMSEGASLTSFAAEINCSRSTVGLWMETHEEFSASVKIGKAKCAAWWEKKSRLGAGGEENVNPTLVIFGLKNMAPDEWREKQEVQHSGSIDINKMSDEELNRRIAELSR